MNSTIDEQLDLVDELVEQLMVMAKRKFDGDLSSEEEEIFLEEARQKLDKVDEKFHEPDKLNSLWQG